MTPKALARKIRVFPERQPITAAFELALKKRGTRDRWFGLQKKHWCGWRTEYEGIGAYGRIPRTGRTAEYAYNHIVCPPMVLWLGEASGVPRTTVVKPKQAALSASPVFAAQSAAIRRVIPWGLNEARLGKGWGKK
jgi:hypothetical protein